MKISVQQGDLTQVPCDAMIVNLFEGVTHPGGATGAVDQALDGWISRLIEEKAFKGKIGTAFDFPTFGKIPAKMIIVVGLGSQDAFNAERVRQAAATAIKRAKSIKAGTVISLLHGAGIAGLAADESAQAVVEGTVLASYDFSKYKTVTQEDSPKNIDEFTIVELDAAKLDASREGMEKGRIIAEATNWARDLATEPPDLVNPEYLADRARELAAEYGLDCEIWDEMRVAEERMNCLIMVGRGSANPPRFIRLTYHPREAARKHICVVGKGICYDSGGLSLKPAGSMKHMKTDMSGAADVLAIIRTIAQLQPDIAVTGLIPACENMTGPLAYKVDDILRARNGKTIEIDNTDAEGRLILADALSYAAEQDYDEVIDFATLTGGCIIALAHVWTGVMGNDQELIDRIVATGNTVGEKMWQFPFDSEIREMLDSDVADIRNSAGREASAIQGGMFLQEFIEGKPWAHLDIAGTSFIEKDRGYEPKGATGVPVRTMVSYILQQ